MVDTKEIECAAIGAILYRPKSAALVSLEPQHFSDPRAVATWAVIRALESAGRAIDHVTVAAELAKSGATFGDFYVGECALHSPSDFHLEDYARRIRDAWLYRTAALKISEVLEQSKRESWTGAELLSGALAAISGLDAELPDTTQKIGALVKERLRQLRDAEDGGAPPGFPTGVEKLDALTGGWQPGIVSIVAARPGMGKSSLGLSTADAASAKGIGVHVFSLEDTRQSYVDRALARTSGVGAQEIRACRMTRGQADSIHAAATRLFVRDGWLVDDRSGISASEVVRSVRRHARDNGTRVAIVDYVQLLKRPRDARSTHEALTESVQTLADAAKQDGIAYVVMSQLNRGVEQRQDKRPMLSDLRESGSLEERAKCVVAIYRGSYYGAPVKGVDYDGDEIEPDGDGDEWLRRCDLLVLKNSNGETPTVRAQFDGPTTRIW